MKKSNGLYKNNTLFALKIILPAFLVVTLFMYYPIFNSIIMAFQKIYFGKREFDWVGLKNFFNIFKDVYFFRSFSWTLIFGVISTVLLLVVGMYFALLLNRDIPFKNFLRGIILIPWAIPWFVNAFLWLWLLDVQYGLINHILVILKILKEPINWMGGTNTARAAVIMAYIYRVFPFNIIVYLASFQTIDKQLYEAAEIDGAGKFKQFFYVTLPQIKNIVIFTALLNFIWTFQEFETMWIITRGGPVGATSTLLVRLYDLGFQSRDFGAAAANGLLWVIFLFLFSIIYLRVLFFRGGID